MIKLEIDRVEFIKQISHEFTYGKGVEIGTFKGEFAKEILKATDIIRNTIYLVDVWRGLGDEYLDASNHNIHTTAYADAMKSIEGYEDRAIMIRADSLNGSMMFQDEFLDFVYIDANHAYNYVKGDIAYWYSKVRKGGYLMGHDYIAIDWYNDPNFMENGKDKHIYAANGFYFGVFGVNPAVDEFCKEHGYTLTITNEWFGTWMIQKK
jgi:hypothetical protein